MKKALRDPADIAGYVMELNRGIAAQHGVLRYLCARNLPMDEAISLLVHLKIALEGMEFRLQCVQR